MEICQVADQYDLIGLRLTGEALLLHSVTLGNIAKLFAFAEQCQLRRLQSACINELMMDSNLLILGGRCREHARFTDVQAETRPS